MVQVVQPVMHKTAKGHSRIDSFTVKYIVVCHMTIKEIVQHFDKILFVVNTQSCDKFSFISVSLVQRSRTCLT